MDWRVRATQTAWLPIAVLAAICAGTSMAHASEGAAHQKPLQSGTRSWAVADFNGDHRPDLITASSTRNLAGSYTHDVQISLGGAQPGSLTFASFDAHIRLRARDVDGDHDADLVVLGSVSSIPIDLWLNDGKGHFRHGDASTLPAERQTASLECQEPDDDTLATVTDEQNPLAAPPTTLWAQAAVTGQPVIVPIRHLLTFDRANIRSRAPPR